MYHLLILYIFFHYRKYLYEQRTSNLDIPYYVKENFLNDYKHRISQIERNVEEEYLVSVRTSCFRERNYSKFSVQPFLFYYIVYNKIFFCLFFNNVVPGRLRLAR